MKTLYFLGDSITRGGKWIAEIFENIKEEYIVYNCGVGGDNATRGLYRLHQTCLNHFPDKVVIMYGMNDVEGHLYDEGYDPTDLQAKKDLAINRFKKSMEEIAETLHSYGIEMIFCTPTPFDDVHFPEMGKTEFNKGLAICADYTRRLAELYNSKCIDFFEMITEYMHKDKYICLDRIHPTPESQHVMAQVFMKETGITESINIDAPFEMSDINKLRHEKEQELNILEIIEWVFLYDFKIKNPEHTPEDKLNEARKLLERSKKENAQNFVEWYTNYIEHSSQMKRIEGELVELTYKMCKANHII